jgi:CMP-N,N'-diacetyllegionaminic acid synthase
VSSYLPFWRPGYDHKKNYAVKLESGGGVILDLSHELDFIEYIFGPIKNVKGVSGRLGDVTFDSEDFADISFQAGKSIVNAHLNFYSVSEKRTLEVNFPGIFFEVDLMNNTLTSIQRKKSGHLTTKVKKCQVSRDDIFKSQITF